MDFYTSKVNRNFSIRLYFFYKTEEKFKLQVSVMGCTVSGVARKHYEQRFVWDQEKSKTINNSEQFSLCSEGHKKSAFKTGKRSTDLGKIIILRTTDSGRNFVAKKIKDSPKIKVSSNSSEINTRVALSNEQNKELCGVDRSCEAGQMKGTVMFGLLSEISRFRIVVNVIEKTTNSGAFIHRRRGCGDVLLAVSFVAKPYPRVILGNIQYTTFPLPCLKFDNYILHPKLTLLSSCLFL